VWKRHGLVNGKGGEQKAKLATVQEEPLLITEGIAVNTEAKFGVFFTQPGKETVLTQIEKIQKKKKTQKQLENEKLKWMQ